MTWTRIPIGGVQRRAALAVAIIVSLAACHRAPRAAPEPESDPDLVNVGYGTQERSKSTVAVGTVDAGEQTVTSWEQLISGRVAGLQVVNGPSGMSFRIRGTGTILSGAEPLIIVDGTPMSGSANLLMSVNPQDVQRIEVLKDAGSTAIYGARGANGVILITLKKYK